MSVFQQDEMNYYMFQCHALYAGFHTGFSVWGGGEAFMKKRGV